MPKYRGVRQASKTTIEISFTYSGKRYYEKLPIKPDSKGLRLASNFRTQILLAIENDTFDYAVSFPKSKHAKEFTGKANTLEYYLVNTYLPRFEKYGKARTIKEYRNCIVNRIIPALGHIDLHKITIPIVKSWVDTLTVSAKTIRNYLSPLRSALNEAVEDGLLQFNPIANYSPKIRSTAPKIDSVDPITYEEEQALTKVSSKSFSNLLTFALWTGLRPQEYLALTWSDVDLIHGTININKAKSDFVEVETTKTTSSNRKLALLEPALTALKAQKELTYLNGKEVFMFNGKRYSGVSQLRRFEWDRAFKLSGVRRRTPKQTRHTFASRMLSNGEALLWVSKYLGHSDPAMTLRAYARFMPDDNNQAGAKTVKKIQGK